MLLSIAHVFQKKAREEVQNVMRGDEILESEMADLKYMDMIVKEIVRLFPIGPVLPRKVNADLELSN